MTELTTHEKPKWTMYSINLFTRKEKGYTATLVLGGFYPTWTIFRDDELIDFAQRHSPVTSSCNKELAAKAQIEKILKELP